MRGQRREDGQPRRHGRRAARVVAVIGAGVLSGLLGLLALAADTSELRAGSQDHASSGAHERLSVQPASATEAMDADRRRDALELPRDARPADGLDAAIASQRLALPLARLPYAGEGPIQAERADAGADKGDRDGGEPAPSGEADDTAGEPGDEAVVRDPVDPAADPPSIDDDAGADGEGADGEWVWPAAGQVTSEFGRRWGRMHEGLDVAQSVGTPVVAAIGGHVRFAKAKSGYGLTVRIDHGEGLETVYSHLSTITVSAGDTIAAGGRVGAMGCTGSCTGPHLHFEVRRGGAPVNPRTVLP